MNSSHAAPDLGREPTADDVPLGLQIERLAGVADLARHDAARCPEDWDLHYRAIALLAALETLRALVELPVHDPEDVAADEFVEETVRRLAG